MTALDILVLILVGGGAFRGFRRGFVHEMLSLAAVTEQLRQEALAPDLR